MDLYDKNAETMMKFKPKTYQQVRLENAADAWKIHKSVYLDTVTGDPQPGFQAWPQFRDEFLIDWKSNRRLVTDKEADVHFDKIADESLSELENIGSLPVDVNALADEVVKADYEGQTNDESPEAAMLPTASVVVVATGEPVVEATVTMGDVPAVKRRGRPPGKAKVVADRDALVPAVSVEAGRDETTKSKPAKVAKAKVAKKKGVSTSAKAATIIALYQSRKWSRKDIIAKLQSQIDGLGAAYASTLYQKFAN